MAATAELRLSARDETQAAVSSALAGLNRIEGGVGRLKDVFTSALGGLGLGLGVQEIIRQTAEAARVQARLEAVLKSTGYAAGITAGQIEDLAQSLKASTAFDDDALKAGLVSLLRFRDIGGDAFRQAAELATDLAVAMNTDLASAFQTIGRLGQEPTEALKGLKGAGFDLRGEQLDLAKALEATGDKAGAQKVAFDELKRVIGGSAAGENAGLYGASRSTAKAWDDMLKAIGQSEVFTSFAITSLDVLRVAVEKLDETVRKTDFQSALGALNPFALGQSPTDRLRMLGRAAGITRQEASGKINRDAEAAAKAAAGSQAREDERIWESAQADNERIGKWLDDQARKRASAARDAASEAKRLAAEQKRIHDEELRAAVDVMNRQLEAEEDFQRESAKAWDIYTQNVIDIRRQAMRDEAEWFGVGSLERFREAGSGLRGWGEGAFGAQAKETQDATAKLSDTARELGLTFQSAFEDAVIAGKSFSEVLEGIEKDLIRVAARRLVTEPLVNAGSALFSGIGDILKKMLPGFASGGSFTVGGSGGVDSKLVAFMATPGERVSVDHGGGGGGGGVVNLAINVDARGTGGASGNASSARDMARALAGEVKQILVQEMRPGGVLGARA